MWAGLSGSSSDKDNSNTGDEIIVVEVGSELTSQLKNTSARKSLGIKSEMTVVEINRDFVVLKMAGLKETTFNKSTQPQYLYQLEKKDADTKANQLLKLSLDEEQTFVTTQLVTDAGLYYSIKLLEITS